MNEEAEKILRERYSKFESRGLDAFLLEHPELKNELELLVKEVPWFENLRNAFIAVCHGIHGVVRCRNCGNPLKVEKAIYGRHSHCCRKCAYESPAANDRRIKTCIEKYGSVTPLLNEECKEKGRRTCMEKFNNEMFAGSDEYKRRVPSPFRNPEIISKSIEKKVERYGEDYGKFIF